MNDLSLKKADRYLKSKEYSKSLSILKRCLKQYPENIAALTMSGLIYKTLGKYDKAIHSFQKVIEFNPNHTGALVSLAKVYHIIGRNEEAIKTYESLSESFSELNSLPFDLAVLYNRTGQYDKAIQYLEEYLTNNPSESFSFFELGVSYKEKNDLSRFKDYFNKAHKIELEKINRNNKKPIKSLKSKIYDWIGNIITLGISILVILFLWDYPIYWVSFLVILGLILVYRFIRQLKKDHREKSIARNDYEGSYKNINKWQKLIEFYQESHQTDKVLNLCEYALLVLPTESDLYLTLGRAYLNINYYSKVIDISKKGIENDPNNVALLNLLGTGYLKAKEYIKAESPFKSIVELTSNNPLKIRNYGLVLFKNRKYDESVKILSQALSLIDQEIQNLLWKLPFKIEFPIEKDSIQKITVNETDVEELKRNYNTFSEYIKYKVQISRELGVALLNIEKFEKAEEIAKESLNVIENPLAYNLLGYLYYVINDYQQSLEFYNKSLNVNENQKDVKMSIIYVSFESGEKDKALNAIKILIQKDPEEERFWNLLGYLYSKMGEFEKAEEALNKAIQINYKYADPWSHLGYIEYKRGNYELAIDLIKKAMKKNPDYSRAPYFLAKILISQGKIDKAHDYCEESLKINPTLKKAKILRKKIQKLS